LLKRSPVYSSGARIYEVIRFEDELAAMELCDGMCVCSLWRDDDGADFARAATSAERHCFQHGFVDEYDTARIRDAAIRIGF
jgi:hypothetical protein